jgi:hypothetical protein
MRGKFLCSIFVLTLVSIALFLLGSSPLAGITERVTFSSTRDQANGLSLYPCPISADGRSVALASGASNLLVRDMSGIGGGGGQATNSAVLSYTITEYFPLGQGDYWEYRTNSAEDFGPIIISGTRVVNGVNTVRLCTLDTNYTPPCITDIEYYTASTAGIRFHGYLSVDCAGGGVEYDYSSCTPALLFIKNGLRIGDRITESTTLTHHDTGLQETLTQTYTFVGVEDVRVPAGIFAACLRIDWERYPHWQVDTVRAWYARGVGLVRLESLPAGGGELCVAELTKAQVGGANYPEAVPPQTVIGFGPCGLVISTGSTAICWSGTDNQTPTPDLRYSWRVDSGAWTSFSSTTCANLSGLSPGVHTLQVTARDFVGNTDLTPAQCSFTVDLSGPGVSITSPVHGATVKGIVNIYAAASHSSGIEKVEFYRAGQLLGADATAPYSCAWDTRPTWVAEGLTQICAKAYANGGKVAWACISVTVDNCTFDDVPKPHQFWRFIEGLVSRGITSGCEAAPPLYCPDDKVTRGQVSKFLCKAAGKTWLDATTPTFADVPGGSTFYGWIERLADSASWGGSPPTSGCTAITYCPDQAVTRAQMAKLLCKARGKTWLAKPTPTFSDVPTSNQFYGWIERLADPGSWGGTAPSGGCQAAPVKKYCPDDPVTRDQMAKFLVLAFGIPYYSGP